MKWYKLKTYFPPNSCIPNKAKIRMNKKSKKSSERMERIEFISDLTRFLNDTQYLKLNDLLDRILLSEKKKVGESEEFEAHISHKVSRWKWNMHKSIFLPLSSLSSKYKKRTSKYASTTIYKLLKNKKNTILYDEKVGKETIIACILIFLSMVKKKFYKQTWRNCPIDINNN